MSETNTNEVKNEVAANAPAFESQQNNVTPEPVNWSKKGNKLSMGSVAILEPDPSLNIRHRAGSEAFGVKITKDTLDIPGMEHDIVELGGIMEPIMVSVRELVGADGKKMLKYVPLRGNRRTYAGQNLLKNPTISAELRKSLLERTPMTLLFGLSPEQEREKIQDQNNKDFLRSEFVKHVFALVRDKWDWVRIAVANYQTYGKFSGNHEKLREVEEITDPTAKKEKIMGWMKGTLNEYLVQGYHCGEFVRKQILMSEMRLDGSLPITGEQPYFYTKVKGGTDVKVDSQKRIAALKKALKADESKPGFQSATLPSDDATIKKYEFWTLVDEYHKLDYGIVKNTPKPTPAKMMGKAALEKIRDGFSSRAVKAVIDRILTDKDVADLEIRDNFAGMMETKNSLIGDFLPKLKPEIANIIRLIFLNPNADDFQIFLEENLAEGEGEAAPAEQAEPGTGEYNLTEADATA